MCATISILMRGTLLAKPWEADPLHHSQLCTWSRSVQRYDTVVEFTLISSGSTWVDVELYLLLFFSMCVYQWVIFLGGGHF